MGIFTNLLRKLSGGTPTYNSTERTESEKRHIANKQAKRKAKNRAAKQARKKTESNTKQR